MRLFVAAALPSLLLAGCQALNDVVGSGSSRESATPTTAAAPAPAPAGGPISTGGLRGMSADALRSAWGEPSLKRAETGVEMWQYAGTGNCTLLVYVYSGAVTHAEAVPGGTSEQAVEACARASGKPSLKPVS